MRIAMMTNNYKPFVGGVPISVEHLAKGLRKKGHEVCIFAPQYEGSTEDKEDEDIVRYRSCEKRLKNKMVIPNIMDPVISREFEKRSFDLIHVHQPMLIGNVAMHLSRKHQIPLVYTYHTRYEEYLHYIGMFSDEKCQKMMRRYLREKGKKLLPKYLNAYANHCDLVIAPSSDLRNYLYQQKIKTPVCVLPTGLSDFAYEKCKESSDRIRREYLGEGKYLLCTVSRMDKEKNLYFLLDCIGKIREQAGDLVKVLFIGEGAEKEALWQYAKEKGLSDTIIFTGGVPNRKVRDYLGACDAFLFSSKSETQGIVLAEAMAAGLPVTAVSACGVNDIVEDGKNGYLAKEDPQAYAKKVLTMLEREEDYKRLKRGAKMTAQNYRMEDIAAQAEQYYQQALWQYDGQNFKERKTAYGYEAVEKKHVKSSVLRLFKMS